MNWLRNKILDWLGLRDCMARITFTEMNVSAFDSNLKIDIGKVDENLRAELSALRQELAEQQKQITLMREHMHAEPARVRLQPQRFSEFKRLMGQGTL